MDLSKRGFSKSESDYFQKTFEELRGKGYSEWVANEVVTYKILELRKSESVTNFKP